MMQATSFPLQAQKVWETSHEYRTSWVLANPSLQVKKAKGIRITDWMVEHKVDLVQLKKSLQGKESVYVFGDAEVETHETRATTLPEAMAEAAPPGESVR